MTHSYLPGAESIYRRLFNVEESVMAFPFTAITVVAQLVVAVADGVPNINYEKGCRASAAADQALESSQTIRAPALASRRKKALAIS